MTAGDVFAEMASGFARRKFSAGLLVSFIDFLVALDVPNQEFDSFEAFLLRFPRQLRTGAGATANTLIVRRPDGRTLSLRPFYNSIERFYRSDQKRFDYPSAAPHATQAWVDYLRWLDSLVTFNLDELSELRSRVNQFVLETLKSQAFDPASIEVEPPLFRLLITGFDMTSQGSEPTGAPFQGIVFGFLRADNPHLQIEIDKVRTGSRRLQRVGDVDGWEGGRLAISAEVKQYKLSIDDTRDLEGFGNATGRQGALGVVAALGFGHGAREAIEALGLIPLEKGDMARIVELWDPVKQRTAVSSLIYYAKHVEKNSSLTDRIQSFISGAREEWLAGRQQTLDREERGESEP
jgi:hypothetical protein